MSCPALLGVLLLSVVFAPGAESFGFGAPSCVDRPNHFAEPQAGPSPFNVTLMNGGASSSWILTVGSADPAAPKYKGILIMPKQAGSLLPVQPSVGAKYFKVVERNCDQPAWTHTKLWSSEGGSMSVWSFTSDSGSTPTFDIHLVEQYSIFWTNVPVTVISGQPATTAATAAAAQPTTSAK